MQSAVVKGGLTQSAGNLPVSSAEDRLPVSGLPIGVLEEDEYGDVDVRLRPRERLWLYPDGLVEAMNPAGQQFGLGRLVAASAGALSDGLRTVLRAVENWAGETGPQDDISLIAIEIGRS